jgi:HK97 family phage portal protein
LGLLDFFRRKAFTATPAVVDIARSGQLNTYRRLGGTNQRVEAAFVSAQSANYGYLYEHQPAVRRVVDYIARSVAQLGLKLYERRDDTEREHAPDHPAARTMAHPNDLDPADRFIFDFVVDKLVYNNAYALKLGKNNGGPLTLISVPPAAVAVNGTGRFTVESYSIYRADGTNFTVNPTDMIHWRGKGTDEQRLGTSYLETLRLLLAEDAASQAASIELSKQGLAKPGYIKRPLEAPEWSEDARGRFQESWANQSKSSPRKTPVLEEGMEFADFGVSPKDAEMLDGRRFTNDEVAALYGMKHCPPADEEERKAFLADVLAPITVELAKQLTFSIAEAEYGAEDYYFEFDLDEKLRGDLENRFQAMTAAAGRPWMTVDEIRALQNLPPVETGDELTIPLNVMIGDNPRPAPNVMPIQDPNKPAQDGSHREIEERSSPPALKAPLYLPRSVAKRERRDRDAHVLEALLRAHFGRQQRVTAAKGSQAKALDAERWNAELAADLHRQSRKTVHREAGIDAARMGEGFDPARSENYLAAASRSEAENINALTAEHVREHGAEQAFDVAKSVRAPNGGKALATGMFALGTKFAIEQAEGPERLVSISGGECEVCAPHQGQTPISQLDGWPPFHANCNCVAEVGA